MEETKKEIICDDRELQKSDLKTQINEELKLFKEVINDKETRKLSFKEVFLALHGLTLGLFAVSFLNYIAFSFHIPQNESIDLPLLMLIATTVFYYLVIREAHLENAELEGQDDNCV